MNPLTWLICRPAPPPTGWTHTSVRPPSSLRYATSFSSWENDKRMPERLPTRRMLRYSSRAIGALGAWPAAGALGSAGAGAGAAAAGVIGTAAAGAGDTGGCAGLPPHDTTATTATTATAV